MENIQKGVFHWNTFGGAYKLLELNFGAKNKWIIFVNNFIKEKYRA